MHVHHRKRRLPVEHRGQRVPNLYRRPKSAQDRREGDTFEVIFRDETGAQRQKTLKSRSLQRAVAEAEDYRTQLRRGELVVSTRLTFDEAAEEFFQITEALVATGERSRRTLDLYRQRYAKHISPVLAKKRIQDVRPDHISAIFAAQRRGGACAVDDRRHANDHLSDPQFCSLPRLHRDKPAESAIALREAAPSEQAGSPSAD
jgi:hypothetical protein